MREPWNGGSRLVHNSTRLWVAALCDLLVWLLGVTAWWNCFMWAFVWLADEHVRVTRKCACLTACSNVTSETNIPLFTGATPLKGNLEKSAKPRSIQLCLYLDSTWSQNCIPITGLKANGWSISEHTKNDEKTACVLLTQRHFVNKYASFYRSDAAERQSGKFSKAEEFSNAFVFSLVYCSNVTS
jgi:hypothetical protein